VWLGLAARSDQRQVPGYPELDIRADDYWLRFWRIYAYVREQNAAG
jgi:hypothetical protein